MSSQSKTSISVLSLVPVKSKFYRDQVRALEAKGVDITTLVVPGGDPSSDKERSIVHYLRFYPKVLRKIVGEYDLIHANFGLTAPHALAQPRLPVVLSLWGTDVFGKYGWVSEICAPLADSTIVMSEEMNEALGGNHHVIPHGVDFTKFRPIPREEALREAGWEPDRRHVLFPWPPHREVKNHDLATRVVDTVNRSLSEEVELHALSDVPHDRMFIYMSAADALLLTSHYEGSPNAIKEALACNLPIVSRDVGDVSKQVAGVDLSFVCQTEDELVDRLIRILELGERSDGREQAQDIRLEQMADQIYDIYKRVS